MKNLFVTLFLCSFLYAEPNESSFLNPLFRAVSANRYDIVKSLIEEDVTVYQTHDGEYPIDTAIRLSFMKIAHLFYTKNLPSMHFTKEDLQQLLAQDEDNF